MPTTDHGFDDEFEDLIINVSVSEPVKLQVLGTVTFTVTAVNNLKDKLGLILLGCNSSVKSRSVLDSANRLLRHFFVVV